MECTRPSALHCDESTENKDTTRKLLYAEDLDVVAEHEELKEALDVEGGLPTTWTECESGEDGGVVDMCTQRRSKHQAGREGAKASILVKQCAVMAGRW